MTGTARKGLRFGDLSTTKKLLSLSALCLAPALIVGGFGLNGLAGMQFENEETVQLEKLSAKLYHLDNRNSELKADALRAVIGVDYKRAQADSVEDIGSIEAILAEIEELDLSAEMDAAVATLTDDLVAYQTTITKAVEDAAGTAADAQLLSRVLGEDGALGDELDGLRAAADEALADLEFSARAGAAIGLVPAHAAEAAIEERALTETLVENLYEVLNIAASLLSAEGVPHVELHQMYDPSALPPAEISACARALGRRLDLVRRDGGGAVASLLVEAMALTEQDLPVLAAARPRGLLSMADRAEVDLASERSPLSSALGEMTRLMVAGSVSEALALTERAPMAGLTDLLRCVRTEVFGWTWEPSGEPSTGARAQRPTAGAAVAVVCDAVAAAFHAAQLSSSLTHQLIEPWAIAQADQPGRAVNLGPCHVEVDALLSRLATLDEDGRRRLLEIGHAVRAQGAWAPSMHSATWAVHMADRVRQGAVAQLRAVRVLRDTELSVTDAAAGTWNLVSGAVQAALVNDLLDDATHERLLAPVLGALS